MRIPLEARHTLGVIGKDRRQDLQCNITPQLGVGSEILLSHAACTELFRHAIMRNALAYHKEDAELMRLS